MDVMNMSDLTCLGMFDYSSILDRMSTHSRAPSSEESLHHSFSDPIPDNNHSIETYEKDLDSPMKTVKTNSWDSLIITNQLSSPQVTFPKLPSFARQEPVSSKLLTPSVERINTKPPLPGNHDRIIAERKKREKLGQKLIALSALVPGLKKMDKASVLEDAVNYLKQLQEQVKELEEQTKKNTMESAVFVKKHELYGEDDDSSSDRNFSGDSHNKPVLEIEARVFNRDVLIRIQCEKKRGVFEKTVAEIEKLHLLVRNSSALTFDSSILDITIVTQMDTGFTVSIKDLVAHLRDFLLGLQVIGGEER